MEVHREQRGGGHRVPADCEGGPLHGQPRVQRLLARPDHPGAHQHTDIFCRHPNIFSVSPAVPGPQAGGAQPVGGDSAGQLQLPLVLRLPRPQHRVLEHRNTQHWQYSYYLLTRVAVNKARHPADHNGSGPGHYLQWSVCKSPAQIRPYGAQHTTARKSSNNDMSVKMCFSAPSLHVAAWYTILETRYLDLDVYCFCVLTEFHCIGIDTW